MTLAQRAWRTPPIQQELRERLAKELGISSLVASVLVARDITDTNEARRFLEPRLSELPLPRDMADMGEAVERIARALEDGERIAVFGDYDADGITATALAVDVLRQLGADVRPWLANRFEGGYGMSAAVIDEIVAEARKLLVVVDCGTSDFEATRRAREKGLDVVIVDHHKPGESLPPVAALVNPHRADCSFEEKGMASVGLVFYLMGALRTKLGATIDLREWLDIVAVGTVADVSPMFGANRILVRKGLEKLARCARPGLAALQIVAGALGRPSTETIAFRLGPRINAAGRLGNPMVALDLLLENDHQRAREIATKLDELSTQRRTIQNEIKEAALPEATHQVELGRPAVVVGGEDWHHGVIGIVAAQLCDTFNRPAAVIGYEDGLGRGSIRAPSGFNVHRALNLCADHLIKFGGHAGAAGFSIDAAAIDAFTEAFSAAIESQALEVSEGEPILIEADILPQEINLGTICELEQVGPFGPKNPEPVLRFRGARVVREDERTGGHVSIIADCGGVRVKGFGPKMARSWPWRSESLDLAFCLRRDSYRGIDQAEIRIVDVKPVASTQCVKTR